MPDIALLHSRQRRRPCADDPWVSATAHAVSQLAENADNTFLCSTDTPGYNLTLSLLAEFHNPIKLFITSEHTLESISRDYNIEAQRIVSIGRIPKLKRYLSQRRLRDELILQSANTLYPISLRNGGYLSKRVSEDQSLRAIIDDRYQTAYVNKSTQSKQDYGGLSINRRIVKSLGERLIHWTKTTNGHWPGELIGEYYRALAGSECYPRDAFSTLRNIAGEQLLRGSTRHMPLDTSAVAFCSASITEALKLMSYRSRDNQMAFEPYGVAVPLAFAAQCGIDRVRYLKNETYAQLNIEEKRSAHALGAGELSWDIECEWRKLGDLSLGAIWNQLIWLVPTEEEAAELRNEFAVEARAIFSDVDELGNTEGETTAYSSSINSR